MHTRTQLLALLLLVPLFGCKIETHGLADGHNFMSVEPGVVCPGEPVEVCWDLVLPRRQELCECPAGFPDGRGPISCVASSDCPEGASCVDGFCCAAGCGPGECGGDTGCRPDFRLTITGDPVPLDPPVVDESGQEQGCRTIRPDRTTTLALEGGFRPPPTELQDEEQTVTVIDARPVGPFPVAFPFVCDRGPGWRGFSVSTLGSVSPNVTVTSVRNTSSHTIDLTGPVVLPGSDRPGSNTTVLRPGATTNMFNGPFWGTWHAALNPTDRAALPPPECTPTAVTNPLPGLSIELMMQCSVEP